MANMSSWSKYFEYITSMKYMEVEECYEILMKRTNDKPIDKVLGTNKNIQNQLKNKKKFDIKKEKAQIENLKKDINKKLISLNMKSRSIESLLGKSVIIQQSGITNGSQSSVLITKDNYCKTVGLLENSKTTIFPENSNPIRHINEKENSVDQTKLFKPICKIQGNDDGKLSMLKKSILI